MKAPLSLLKEYLNFTQSPQELADVLTLAGVEVDGIDTTPITFSGVVVGHVLETSKHPHADRLVVARVTDGKDEFQVVCGAPNCRAGIKVAFAKIGASLKDKEGKPFTIKQAKLRDVPSFGMLCGADELGLGSGEGIMELSEEFEVGTELAPYYEDVILDLSFDTQFGALHEYFGARQGFVRPIGDPSQAESSHFKRRGRGDRKADLCGADRSKAVPALQLQGGHGNSSRTVSRVAKEKGGSMRCAEYQ